MKKPKTKASRFSKKQIVLLIIASITVVSMGLWGWNQVAPRPLGDGLEYLGKEDGGGFIKPYSVYHYGTDMAPEEVVAYFPKAELRYPIERKSGYIEIILRDRTSEESATLYYYETKEKAQIDGRMKTEKSHIVQTRDDNYQMLKDVL